MTPVPRSSLLTFSASFWGFPVTSEARGRAEPNLCRLQTPSRHPWAAVLGPFPQGLEGKGDGSPYVKAPMAKGQFAPFC